MPLQGKLRLFAPAIIGYQPSGALGLLARSPLGWGVDYFLQSTSSPYQDLKKSIDLGTLQKDTEHWAESHQLLRAELLWGDDDHVVKPGKYACDEYFAFLPGHTHCSICKPNTDFTVPLEFTHP